MNIFLRDWALPQKEIDAGFLPFIHSPKPHCPVKNQKQVLKTIYEFQTPFNQYRLNYSLTAVFIDFTGALSLHRLCPWAGLSGRNCFNLLF